MEPEVVPFFIDRDRRLSFSNDRALNPSIYEVEQESVSSSRRTLESPIFLNRRFSELSVGVVNEEIVVGKPVATKSTGTARTPRLTPAKDSATPRRQKTSSNIGPKHDLVSSRKMVTGGGALYSSFEFYLFIDNLMDGFYIFQYHGLNGRNSWILRQ